MTEKAKNYSVRCIATYEAIAVVKAVDGMNAAEMAEMAMDDGDIDVVDMKGTLKTGGFERHAEAIGVTKDAVTVGRKPRLHTEAYDGTRLSFPVGFPRKNLDDHTRRLANYLRDRIQGSCSTPFIDTPFVTWLVYDATIQPCGLRVESVDPDYVTFEANCSGVQTQGICLSATFKVPTDRFTTADLVKMIGPYRHHRNGPACRFEWFPKLDDPRIGDEFITELEWWYDNSYDEEEEE